MCPMVWHVWHGVHVCCNADVKRPAQQRQPGALLCDTTAVWHPRLPGGFLGLRWACAHNRHAGATLELRAAARGAIHVRLVHGPCGTPCVSQGYGLTETTAASFIMLPTPKMAYTRGFAVTELLQWVCSYLTATVVCSY